MAFIVPGPGPTTHVDSDQVTALLARQLPGVRLVSAVQGWAFLELFQQGINEYIKISEPTADDERWAGICHFKLFDDNAALELLTRAASRGAMGALINKAHVLMFLDRSDESVKLLDKVDPRRLGAYDTALYHRVRSLYEETGGNIRAALKHAEEAWKRVQGIPEFHVLAPSVLAQLGVLYARYGRAQRALWHLERGIQMTPGAEQLKVRLKRAIVLTTLGRYAEARSELQSAQLHTESAGLEAERRLLLGDVAWSTGELATAVSHYGQALDLASRSDLVYEEFLCHTALMTLHAFMEQHAIAVQHRTQAAKRLSDKSDRLQFRFREVIVDHWRGALDRQAVASTLSQLADDLFDMGLLQEMGAVRLHLAAVELGRDPDRSLEILDEVHVLSVTLQNSSFLAREWLLLPDLHRFASKARPALAGLPSAILELRTLGEERIMLAGSDVRLPLRRAPELLAFFMEHKTATFARVKQDLFPDEKHRTAKSYFHQFRHQLKEHVEGLQIEYDPETRSYRLKSDIDILWDVADLRAGRRKDPAGSFLPSATSDWALTLDHALERYRPAG